LTKESNARRSSNFNDACPGPLAFTKSESTGLLGCWPALLVPLFCWVVVVVAFAALEAAALAGAFLFLADEAAAADWF
jgi:hypothetical protein